MAKILCSGGAGQLGSWLVDYLVDRGHDVSVIDNLSRGKASNLEDAIVKGARLYVADLRDGEKTREIVEAEKPEILYVLHAHAAEIQSLFNPIYTTMVNYVGFLNLLVPAVNMGVKTVVATTSMAVYGNNPNLPFSETEPTNPEDPYGITKAATERLLYVYGKEFGFNWVVIRPHNCYDAETEVLTVDGFKQFPNITKEDWILTLNPKTNIMEYHQPTEIQTLRYNGEMYHFLSTQIDLKVTPDHNLYLRRHSRWPFELIEAKKFLGEDIAHYYSEFSREGRWIGENHMCTDLLTVEGSDIPGTFQPPNVERVPMQLWLEFMGWYLSEGSTFKTDSNYIVSITQKNEENRTGITQLIKSMGFNPYFNKPQDVRIFSKQLYTILKPFGKAHQKFIPRSIKNLSPPLLKIFLHALMMGDGDITDKGVWKRYSTVSKRLADDVQEMMLKLGMYCTLSLDTQGCYRLSIGHQTGTPWIGYNTHKDFYDGIAYDVTVPNHILMVRRKGKLMWSGNCYGPRQDISNPYRNVLGIWMNRIMQGKPPIIYGDGLQKRAFTHIDDCTEYIAEAAFTPKAYGEIINIGSEAVTTLNYACEKVIEAMETDIRPIHGPPRPAEVREAYCSSEKARRLLGYETTTSLEEGLRMMATWAKEQGPQEFDYWTWDDWEVKRHVPDVWRLKEL